jgi:peptidoglycan/xylan/chitin deacetylase (PgdA/CDA1 family)
MSYIGKISFRFGVLASAILSRRVMRWGETLPPVVSFTFDDFPASAQKGADILETVGAHGTFYLSAGLLGKDSAVGRIADEALVRRLSAAGHEIGCHTYSHCRARDTSGADYRRDVEANHAALRERWGLTPRSFAFPFGSVTPSAKATASAFYPSSRTTIPGVNRGRFDASFLRANRLYGVEMTEEIRSLIQRGAMSGGWLIFYTHDVGSTPGTYGCGAGKFESVVRETVAAGYEIRTVESALSLISL